MLFYTPEFLAFSLVLLATLGVVTRHEPRKLVLLVASYIFYMWWNPAFIALILFATGVNYALGLAIAREASDARRRLWLIVSVVASLGLLAYFKYSGFLAENTLYVMRTLGFDVHWTSIDVVLPVGISFYVFQTLSYTIDLYRQKLPATTSPLDFALYVAFFPQLVAGPIVRASDFLPQLTRPALIRCDQASFFLLLRGLTKKVLIADNVAILADAVFDRPEAFPSIVIWLAAICFAIQIYCDFSGYSDIAIAIARILGFEIPLNFNHPYLASNPSDFWRRWHISLSSWLRDYLYISLGGNRRGRLRTYVNLMLTMLLGGLWHGASWNFLLWGFVHGILLTAHRCYGDIRRHLDTSYHPLGGPVAKICCIVAMQYFVLLSWIPFRVTNVSDLAVALRKFVLIDMDLRLANIGLGGISLVSTVVLLAAFGVLHGLSARVGHLDRLCGRVSLGWASVSCVLLGFAASLLWPLTDAPFIYFQF
jgi:alginate O-acetyltransferase complex protein AlgI